MTKNEINWPLCVIYAFRYHEKAKRERCECSSIELNNTKKTIPIKKLIEMKLAWIYVKRGASARMKKNLYISKMHRLELNLL